MQEVKHLIKQWDIKVKNNKRLFFSNNQLYTLHNLLSDFVEIIVVLKKYMITLYQIKRNIATSHALMEGEKYVNFPRLQREQ